MLRPLVIDSLESGLLTVDSALVPQLGAALIGRIGAIANNSNASSLIPSQPSLGETSLPELIDDNLFPPGQFRPVAPGMLAPDLTSSSAIAAPRLIDLGAGGVNVAPVVIAPSSTIPSQTPVANISLAPATQLSAPEEPLIDGGANDNSTPSDVAPFALPGTVPDLKVRHPLATTYQGELSEEDDDNPQRFATFKDDYILNVDEDSTVEFGLTSTAFDTYLQLLRFGGDEVFVFDDDSGQGRNSQLSLPVEQGDRFIVRVTSYDREAIGPYSLSLTSQGAGSFVPDGENPEGSDNPVAPLPPLVDSNLHPNLEQFTPRSGYGLVNAAAAVAAALTLAQPELTEPVADAPDLGGFDQPLDSLRVPEVWAQGFTGSGVTIAVIDSGLDRSHPELQDSLWINSDEIAGDGIDNDQNGYIDDVNGWNFDSSQLNNVIDPGTDSPFQGHGTHVAGIIAGANDGNGNTGVAYDAKIMSLRLGDTNNVGLFLNPGHLATAVRYAVDNGANVINLSLGWADSPALHNALEYAADHNVVVVGASGNRGFSIPVNPARYAINWGLSVGAVTDSGRLATFSNGAGTNADIRHVLAPGNNIVSAEPGGGYETRTGTSMAASYVSGVVALMLSANPSLTNGQVRDLLAATATAIL